MQVSILTPLETDWQSSCIQSAMSCSLLALSSSGGRSVKMTWKACGRSVLFERRQPPQYSPLTGAQHNTIISPSVCLCSFLLMYTKGTTDELSPVESFSKLKLTPWWPTWLVPHQFFLHRGTEYLYCKEICQTCIIHLIRCSCIRIQYLHRTFKQVNTEEDSPKYKY